MWPVLLDMTRDECKRVLRRLELEAYSSVVSTFRAQGDLTKDKKKMLQNLQNILSISTERHRAEVRRAVNDEKLATIADNMFGPNTTAEWLIEGRRLVPLMPRLVPQTAFTATANQAANLQAEKNAGYPSPCLTSNKDLSQAPTASVTPPTVSSSVNKISRPSSPGSNVVVLPSGMSIHIKGGLNTEADEELQARKRRRSQSTESIISPSASTQTPRVTYTTTAPSCLPGMSPVKITISKSPQARPQVTTTTAQKMIIVSNASQTSTSNILHRSVTVPVIKSSTSGFSAVNPNKTSIIYPNTVNGSLGNMVTVTTSGATQALSTVTTSATVMGTVPNTFLTPTMTLAKPRTRMVIPRQKFTQQQQQKPGVVIPMGPQPVHASPSQNIQIKTVPKSTPTIQIKQEGGMKIITQSLPAGTSKILPKPSQLSAHGTPVVVVSGGSSGAATSAVTMVTRPVSTVSLAGTHPGTKILNITQGGKVISTSSTKYPNVLTVTPKTLHLTAVRTPGGATGGKPNIIVVQKAQHKTLQSIAAGTSGTTKLTTSGNVTPFERELVSFLEKQDSTKRIRMTTAAPGAGQPFEKKVIITTPMLSEAAKQKAKLETEDKKSSLLAELIQAAGILPEGASADTVSGEVAVSLDESAVVALAATAQSDTAGQTKIDLSQPLGGNEWFEYDVGDEQTQSFSSDSSTATAIQSILDPPQSTTQRVALQRSASLDLSQLSEHLSQQQFYTIEQAMRLVNQAEREEVQLTVPTTVSTPTTGGAISLLHVSSQDSVPSQPPIQVQPSAMGVSESDSQESQNTTLSNITSSSSGGDVERIGTGITQELLGELDPETGLFSNNHNRTRRIITIGGKVAVQTEKSSAMPKNLDLLSSSLAQAQIDLDPYQFIEEIGGFSHGKLEVGQQNLEDSQKETSADAEATQPVTPSEVEGEKEVAINTEEVTSGSLIEEDEVTKASENDLPAAIEETEQAEELLKTIQSTVQQVSTVANTFIPLQELGKTTPSSTITIKTHPQPAVTAAGDSVHVAVEPSSMNPDQMKIEDFASQQVQDKGDYPVELFDEKSDLLMPEEFQPLCSPATGTGSGSDSQGDNSCDPNHPTRVSCRKRRAPASIDTDFPQAVGGWVRSAMGLLQRICRYRGQHKEKGEMGAASWFTQPVDPKEAPDYYRIVKKPMDFSSIRKKLESGQYQDYDEFHSDMLQVRKNCLLYNPPSSAVRQDCDDVFNFYVQEYEKLVERWQKSYTSSPKKPRLDKSPVRP